MTMTMMTRNKLLSSSIASSYRASRIIASSTRRLVATCVDTLIVGGGPIGSSTAYHLTLLQQQHQTQEPKTIWVVERDPTYRSASATVSAAGIRQQFSLRENIAMSVYGRDFLRQAHELLRTHDEEAPNVQFVEHGYLFLAANETGVQQLHENHKLQQEILKDHKDDIVLLSPTELATKFPWLNIDDIRLGSLGLKGEGWFDPWALLMAFKNKNTTTPGIVYKHATPTNVQRCKDTGAIQMVELLDCKSQQKEWIQVNQVVNAAGAYANDLLQVLEGAEPLTAPFPVRPRKRSMFFFHCSADHQEEGHTVPQIAPLTIDPLTGVYFRSEGLPGAGTFVCGVSPPAAKDTDYHWNPSSPPELQADYELWEEIIWPALYHRVPAFGNIKLLSSWAGLYEYNTLDQNCILDFHPQVPNLLLVNGFSGHGLQHGPAAGRAAAELLTTGTFQTLDLSVFGYDRVLRGEPVLEQGIV